LIKLQQHIIGLTKKFLKREQQNIGKKLLSQCVDKFSLTLLNDNEMSQILIDWMSKERLESYEDSLSSERLKYF